MLFIDSRERKENRALFSAAAGPATVLFLECADFLLFDKDGHSLGIERKSVSDLLGSLSKRRVDNNNIRLDDQLDRMKSVYSHRMLLIEGRLQFNVVSKKIITGQRQTQWWHWSIQAILWSIQAGGTTVMWTDDKHATGDLLRGLHQRAERGCVLPRALKDQEQEEMEIAA